MTAVSKNAYSDVLDNILDEYNNTKLAWRSFCDQPN